MNFWKNSEWKPLSDQTKYIDAAVYELRIVTEKGVLTIPRFLEIDVEGILSIGETNNLERRRRQFIRGIENRAKHSEGNLWHYIRQHSHLLNIYPQHSLEFRFGNEADKTAAKWSEEKLIKAYICKFGEPPPLNCAIPNRQENWDFEDIEINDA